MSSKKWALYALYGFLFHILLCVIGIIAVSNNFMSNGLFYASCILAFPGIGIIMLQFLWVSISVISREFPGSRFSKVIGILFLGPIATIYIGIKYGKR